MTKKKVDDAHVKRIIDAAMNDSKQTGIPQIEHAFKILQEHRQQPGMSSDLNFAAAEWYAYSRFTVAIGYVSQSQMIALSYAYYAKKVIDNKFGNPDAEAVTKNPVSEPNIDVAEWGVKGAKQGVIDHAKYNVKDVAPIWRSVDSILGQEKGGYRSVGAK